MKITSAKNAVLFGITYAGLTFLAYVTFTCLVDILLQGQYFISKSATPAAINGIPFWALELSGGIISAIVSIVSIRYALTKYVFIAIITSIITYIAFFCCVLCGLTIIVYISAEIATSIPLNSFDSLFFGLFVFPIGAAAGTIIAIVINEIQLRRKH
uniref:Uncharacterized protein n=1 Tax=uncultured Bacillota bacterium TaxID=344338 RepID=A0A650EMW7_9FIRM|nr:hypothetical protein Firmicute1046_2730 [uncultured Firmicutes bacterium]